MTSRLRLVAVLSFAVVSVSGFCGQPVERAELEALRARVRELEEQLRVIAQRLDAAAPPASGQNGGRGAPLPGGPLAGARSHEARSYEAGGYEATASPADPGPLAGARSHQARSHQAGSHEATASPTDPEPLAGARSHEARSYEARSHASLGATAAGTNPGPLGGRSHATVSDRGYALASADGENAIRIHGLVQLDSRIFFNDADAATDTFVLRRARLISDGILARRFGFQFVTEFGGNDFSIRDASLTAQLSESVQLKAGKFKPPVGLELLQAGQVRPFVERSLVTNLVPIRDLGVQLGGDVLDGSVSYAVGIFNGVPDGVVAGNIDADEPKDVAARLMARPFAGRSDNPLRGLAVGVAGSRGRQRAAAGHLPLYRTDGQQVFFGYGPGVAMDGGVSRLSPQFDYRLGPLGVTGEYIVSATEVRAQPDAARSRLRHRAWSLTSGWVVTGEDSSFGGLVPRTDFNPGAGTWGTFEVVARFGGVELDDATFPFFAEPSTNAQKLRAIGVGLNWHLSGAARFMFNYVQTDFDAPAATGPLAPLLRQGENLFSSRLQLAF